MKKLIFLFLFSLAAFLPFLSQPALAARCQDEGYYYDSRKGGGGCVWKHAGSYDPKNRCSDNEGCVYAYTIMPYDAQSCPTHQKPVTKPEPSLTEVEKVIGQIVPPRQVTGIGFGAEGLNNFFNKAIALIYGIAGLIFLVMVIVSALQWIMSGGDKEAVGNARKRLTYAVIGLALLTLTFVLLNTIGRVLGFEFFGPGLAPGCDIPT